MFVAGATLTAGSTVKYELECTGTGSTEQANRDAVASGCGVKVQPLFSHGDTESTENGRRHLLSVLRASVLKSTGVGVPTEHQTGDIDRAIDS